MDLLELIQNKNRILFFTFGDDNYMDEVKISLEVKNNKIYIKYFNIGLDHIEINSKLVKNNSSYCKHLLTELGHINSNAIVIDCSMYHGKYKFPYCFCSYKNKKIIIIKKDHNNYWKLYEYIKFPYGIFTNRYSIPMVFNLSTSLL
jgi:hypothetical protein